MELPSLSTHYSIACNNMDRLDDVTVFLAVAEHGSFAQAARRLGRSPAVVTRAVASLETRLGVRLFNRTTRAVSLTDVGQRFRNGARRVVADFDEIEREAAGQGNAPRGDLAVTAPILFGRLHVLPVVTEFLAQYPDVTVRLLLVDRSVDLIEEGLDVAIRIGVLRDSSAIATSLGALRSVVVTGPSYLARRGEPQQPADLTSHDIVVFTNLWSIERWIFENGVSVAIRPRLAVTTAEAAIDAAKAGFGITRALGYQVADAIADGSLVRLLRAHEVEPWPLHLLYPSGPHPAPKLRAFVDFTVPRLRQRAERVREMLDR
jgi:DNA-binding transcriptional LysR family regulator